jgi:hypothetical protein
MPAAGNAAGAAPERGSTSFMRKRTRKLVGTVAMLAFVLVYAPVAVTLAGSRLAEASAPVQLVACLVLGLVWILPLLPLIRWMERPDPERTS